MNIRKKFNILNKEQKQIVYKQSSEVFKVFQTEEKKFNSKLYDEADGKHKKDKICSKCGSDKVVNKVITKTRYEIDGWSPLFGERGHNESKNEDINKCSSCGNEWEKYLSYDDWTLGERIYYKAFVNKFNNKSDYPATFKIFIEPFKEFYAETINGILKKEKERYSWLKKDYKIELSDLRTVFKSVFDEK